MDAPVRGGLIRQAFLLEWITIIWMVIEAAVAIGSGLAARSVSLLAFGLDSLIELVSAGVLIWRLSVEVRRGQAFSEHAERLASRIGGCLLFALAVYVVASAGWSLWMRQGQEFSLPGLAVALAAIPIMYILSKRKLVVANQLGSRAMRADAVESITCGVAVFRCGGRASRPALVRALVGRRRDLSRDRLVPNQRGPRGLGGSGML